MKIITNKESSQDLVISFDLIEQNILLNLLLHYQAIMDEKKEAYYNTKK